MLSGTDISGQGTDVSGGALISIALSIAALTSVVKSTDFSGTEHHRTDISEFRAPTLVALTIVALTIVALTIVALKSVALTSSQ